MALVHDQLPHDFTLPSPFVDATDDADHIPRLDIWAIMLDHDGEDAFSVAIIYRDCDPLFLDIHSCDPSDDFDRATWDALEEVEVCSECAVREERADAYIPFTPFTALIEYTSDT